MEKSHEILFPRKVHLLSAGNYIIKLNNYIITSACPFEIPSYVSICTKLVDPSPMTLLQ